MEQDTKETKEPTERAYKPPEPGKATLIVALIWSSIFGGAALIFHSCKIIAFPAFALTMAFALIGGVTIARHGKVSADLFKGKINTIKIAIQRFMG